MRHGQLSSEMTARPHASPPPQELDIFLFPFFSFFFLSFSPGSSWVLASGTDGSIFSVTASRPSSAMAVNRPKLKEFLLLPGFLSSFVFVAFSALLAASTSSDLGSFEEDFSGLSQMLTGTASLFLLPRVFGLFSIKKKVNQT